MPSDSWRKGSIPPGISIFFKKEYKEYKNDELFRKIQRFS